MQLNNGIAHFLTVVICVILFNYQACSGTTDSDTGTDFEFEPRQPLETKDRPVLIAVAVDTLNNTFHCLQMYGAYISGNTTSPVGYDEKIISLNIFKDTLTSHMKITNVELSRLHFLGLRCTVFHFHNFPADLIILFPSEPFRQCNKYTNLCEVVIARHQKITAVESNNSSDETSFSDGCVTLFSGRMIIPSVPMVQKQRDMLLKRIRPASETCDEEAFASLTQGLTNVHDYDPLIATEHVLVKRAAVEPTEYKFIPIVDVNKTVTTNTTKGFFQVVGGAQVVYRKGYLTPQAIEAICDLLSLCLLLLFGVVIYKFFRVYVIPLISGDTSSLAGSHLDGLILESLMVNANHNFSIPREDDNSLVEKDTAV